MNKKLIYLFLFSIVTLCSCGGVIGNIQKYSFTNTNADTLDAAIRRVYHKFPTLIKSDTSMYGHNEGNIFYFILNEDNERIVFKCTIISYPPPYDKNVDLSLTTAAKWGNVMKLASKMGYWQKRKYRKSFEKHILPKIYNELNRQE